MQGRVEGFRDQMVQAGQVRMHAVVGGNGTPLVLIHGFPQTGWMWHWLAEERPAETAGALIAFLA